MRQDPLFEIIVQPEAVTINYLNASAEEVFIAWDKYSGQKKSNLLFYAFLMSCTHTRSEEFDQDLCIVKLTIEDYHMGEVKNALKYATNWDSKRGFLQD